jgi:hypothetical protein
MYALLGCRDLLNKEHRGTLLVKSQEPSPASRSYASGTGAASGGKLSKTIIPSLVNDQGRPIKGRDIGGTSVLERW